MGHHPALGVMHSSSCIGGWGLHPRETSPRFSSSLRFRSLPLLVSFPQLLRTLISLTFVCPSPTKAPPGTTYQWPRTQLQLGVYGFTNGTVEPQHLLLRCVTAGGHRVTVADLPSISKTCRYSRPYHPVTAGPSPDRNLHCAASPSATWPVAAWALS